MKRKADHSYIIYQPKTMKSIISYIRRKTMKKREIKFLMYYYNNKDDKFIWDWLKSYIKYCFNSLTSNNNIDIRLFRLISETTVEEITFYNSKRQLSNNTELNIAYHSGKMYFNNDINYYLSKGHNYINDNFNQPNKWNSVLCIPIKNKNKKIIGFLTITFSKSLREDININKINRTLNSASELLCKLINTSNYIINEDNLFMRLIHLNEQHVLLNEIISSNEPEQSNVKSDELQASFQHI